MVRGWGFRAVKGSGGSEISIQRRTRALADRVVGERCGRVRATTGFREGALCRFAVRFAVRCVRPRALDTAHSFDDDGARKKNGTATATAVITRRRRRRRQRGDHTPHKRTPKTHTLTHSHTRPAAQHGGCDDQQQGAQSNREIFWAAAALCTHFASNASNAEHRKTSKI